MEQITLSQAIIKVAELEKIYRTKLYRLSEDSNSTTTYILESDGQRYDCNDPFEFKKEFDLTMELSQKIEFIRTEIARANNTTNIEVLGTTLTIQGVLNKLKILREQSCIIDNILASARASKQRKVDAAATSVYYKVTELNFDKKELEQLLENMNNDILTLELAVNKANNETVITIA